MHYRGFGIVSELLTVQQLIADQISKHEQAQRQKDEAAKSYLNPGIESQDISKTRLKRNILIIAGGLFLVFALVKK